MGEGLRSLPNYSLAPATSSLWRTYLAFTLKSPCLVPSLIALGAEILSGYHQQLTDLFRRYHRYIHQEEDRTEDRVAMRKGGRGREKRTKRRKRQRGGARIAATSPLYRCPPVRCIKNATSFNERISWRGSHCHSSSVSSYSGLRSLCTQLLSPRGSVGLTNRASTTRFLRVSRLMTLFLFDAKPRRRPMLTLISIFCRVMTDMCR